MEKALTKYFWVFNLVTLAVVAFLLASGTGEMVAANVSELLPQTEQPDGPARRGINRPRVSRPSFSKRDGTDILRRNIFDSVVGPILRTPEEEFDEFDVGRGAPGELPIVKCTGGVKVMSTVASPDNQAWSFATLTTGGQTDLYRVGDEVEGRTISGITWRYVFLRGTADECYVDMYGAEEPGKPKPKRPVVARGDIAGGIQVDGPNERTVDRSVVDSALANPAKFARSVRVRPYKKNGEVTGFRLRRIKKGSPLELLGAKKGDVIHSVNGVGLTSVDEALAAYQNLRNENRLVFSITRKGKPTELTINIK
jgi:type II secretion system protein C